MEMNELELNERVVALSESFTLAFADRVRKLKASGIDIIALQTGDPDFKTPPEISEVAAQAMRDGLTHYGDSRGLLELRQAVAARMARVHGAEYDPATEILVTHGAMHGYYAVLQTILNPGDEVLVPDPVWPTHSNMVKLLGAKAIRVASTPEDGFVPTLDAWEQAVTPKSVALVINSPNNPTGTVADGEYLQALNQFAAAHNLYVISDEVYDSLLYDGHEHVCFATLPGAKARTLLLNSLSKTYAMTGWRVGYLCAPKEVISQALKVSQHSITNLAPFAQKAAAFALTDPAMQEASKQMVAAYARRRDLVLRIAREFGDSPIKVTAPEGAFYFFLDARALNGTSIEIAERLLEEAHVAIVAGSAYGACGEGFLRMTIAASDEEIEAGFRAILNWAAQQ